MDSCPLCGKELKSASIKPHVKNSCPANREAREKEEREERERKREERERVIMDSKVPCPLCGKKLMVVSVGPHVKNSCPANKEAREKEKREKLKKEREERNKEREIRRVEKWKKKETWHASAEWKERKKFKREYPVLFGQFKVLMKHVQCECTCSICREDNHWMSAKCSCDLGSDKPWY